jgi:hypothetical protein
MAFLVWGPWNELKWGPNASITALGIFAASALRPSWLASLAIVESLQVTSTSQVWQVQRNQRGRKDKNFLSDKVQAPPTSGSGVKKVEYNLVFRLCIGGVGSTCGLGPYRAPHAPH